MIGFDPIQVVLTTANGVLVVPDVMVRRKSKEEFSLHKSAPSCDAAPLPTNPVQPFSLDPSTANGNYRVAKLKFDPAAIGPNTTPGWHEDAFDLCLCLTQVIDVKGVGPLPLTINLSCTEDPLRVNGLVAKAFLAVGEVFIATVATILLLIRKKFSQPSRAIEKHAHEEQVPEHSTLAR